MVWPTLLAGHQSLAKRHMLSATHAVDDTCCRRHMLSTTHAVNDTCLVNGHWLTNAKVWLSFLAMSQVVVELQCQVLTCFT